MPEIPVHPQPAVDNKKIPSALRKWDLKIIVPNLLSSRISCLWSFSFLFTGFVYNP